MTTTNELNTLAQRMAELNNEALFLAPTPGWRTRVESAFGFHTQIAQALAQLAAENGLVPPTAPTKFEQPDGRPSGRIEQIAKEISALADRALNALPTDEARLPPQRKGGWHFAIRVALGPRWHNFVDLERWQSESARLSHLDEMMVSCQIEERAARTA